MKMELKFEYVNDKKINIKNGDKVLGHIFTPAGSGSDILNSIQICGFEDAYDLWGCGIFGEKHEYTKRDTLEPKGIERIKEQLKHRPDSSMSNEWKKYLKQGYIETTHITGNMKKDIQLLFTDYENNGRPNAGMRDCLRCYSEPCKCENVAHPNANPYKVKRYRDVIDKLEFKDGKKPCTSNLEFCDDLLDEEDALEKLNERIEKIKKIKVKDRTKEEHHLLIHHYGDVYDYLKSMGDFKE